MKLKYYLRGMGIGIILTAIVMGFALGGRKAAISDAEVIQRARALGMVEESGTLTQATWEAARIDEEETATSSGEALDGTGNQISEENQQETSEIDTTSYTMADASQEIQEQGEETAATAGSTDAESTEKKTNDVTQEIIETKPLNVASASEAISQAVSDNSSKTVTSSDASAAIISSAATASASSESTLQLSDTAVPVASASASASESAQTMTASSNTGASTESSTASSTSEAAAAATVTPAPAGKSVTIPKGCGSDTVAQILFKEGLVDNAVSFNQFLVTTGMDRKLRAGVKNIPESGDYQSIAEVLIQG